MSNRNNRQSLTQLTSEERIALFEQLTRKKKAQQPSSTSSIPRQSRDTHSFPLSFAQQRLWFLDQFEPNTPLYTITQAFRIQGHLYQHTLRYALEGIVARHELLRTTYGTAAGSTEGSPEQIIAAQSAVPIPLLDLRGLAEPRREAVAKQLATAEAQRPFDLNQGPILRVTLLRLDTEVHILLLTIHHIASDGWSQGIFINELMTLYTAFLHGKRSPLLELPIQYADFAIWQRERLQGKVLEDLLGYWKKQLAALPTLQLPTDHPRPPLRSIVGAIASQKFPADLFARLKQLGRQEDASLFMVLLAAFNVLLSRYTGSTDIPVGTLIANRNRAEIEGLIGFFVNTLVLRANLAGDPRFRTLIKQAREVCLEAYAHQDLPFELVVEELQPKRDVSISGPLAQVMLVLQNTPETTLELPGLVLQPLLVDTHTAKFDISLYVIGDEHEAFLEIEYNRDLFEEATIKRMLGHFVTILEAVTTNPDQPLSALPLLTPTELHQVLIEWNATQAPLPQEMRIHRLFEAQAARTPDTIALVYDDEQLTYCELNTRANRLAYFLQGRGVDRGMLVGIHMERSLEQIISVFGILKAGGAYVPFDPTYPAERLAFTLENSQAAVVLTQATLASRMPPASGLQVFCLDHDWSRIADNDERNPTSMATNHDLAYVIYTSGSTGRPKGVMVEHRSAINLKEGMQAAIFSKHVTGTLRATMNASLSFDASMQQLLLLLAGHTLHLLPEWLRRDSTALVEYMRVQAIDLLDCTPTQLQTVCTAGLFDPAYSAPSLVLVAGEAVSETLWQQMLHAEKTIFYNSYGPTEGTVNATTCLVERHLERPAIGRPYANYHVHILDRHLQPVPSGVAGELHIGGTGLARGYLNRPDLTAERFVPHPFSAEPGARLYKTGDLARYLPSGAIEYVGRNDSQVKIRGYRIELGEIEAALRHHPAVHEAVVVAQSATGQQRDASSDKRLIAYVVQHQQQHAQQESSHTWSAKQVAYWQDIFETTYREASKAQDSAFTIAGCKSSYTGQPLLEEEMHEWVDTTVERILSLLYGRDRSSTNADSGMKGRVLEIGCGTGLLLSSIAPCCVEYWSTDFSPQALHAVQTLLSERGIANVTLLQRNADDFSGVLAEQSGAFDAVILNSVTQFFPNVEYLLRVMEGALRLVAPGGFLFVGDIRNLLLLEAFHTSVQLRRAPLTLVTDQLRGFVQRQLTYETELLIAPAFFTALQQHQAAEDHRPGDAQWRHPQISQVEFQLKRGRQQNELTRFRYDVTLHVERAVEPLTVYAHLDWQQEQLTLPILQQMLEQQQPMALHILSVPNARISTDMQVLSFLHSEALPPRVEDVWEAVRDSKQSGVEPEDFWRLGDTLPYAVTITYSPGMPACYDVLLVRSTTLAVGRQRPLFSCMACHVPESMQPWREYTNNPSQSEHTSTLAPELRTYLKHRLPDYMLPAAIMELDALPLTPNGKVDRKALPAPDGSRPELKSAFVAPRTSVEKTLADIWSQVLGIEQVGVNDNFFELGGDSLMTIRVVTKANQAGLSLIVKQMFQHQTIAELVQAVDSTRVLAEQGLVTGRVALMPVHHMSLDPGLGDPINHSMCFIIEAAEPFDPECVQQVVRHLLMYHDVLRLRTIQTESGWELFIADIDETLPFRQVDLSHLPEVEQVPAVKDLGISMTMNFNLSTEPMLRVALCYTGPHKPTPLVMVVHSFSADMESWQFLLEDFKTAYQQVKETGAIHFPPKTTSFKQWTDRLEEYTQSEQLRAEIPFWLSEARKNAPALPIDFPGGVDDGASVEVMLALFNPEETQELLQLVAKKEGLRMDAIFLTGVAQAFTRWIGQRVLHVRLEGYGREPLFEDIDLSHTLGSFAINYPVLLDLRDTSTLQETLQAVHEQLGQVPHHGIGYSVLSCLYPDQAIIEELAAIPRPEVYFNYLGTLLVPGVAGYKVAGPYNGRVYTLHTMKKQAAAFLVNCSLADSQFQVAWYFSKNQYRIETVRHLGRAVREEVRSLMKLLQ